MKAPARYALIVAGGTGTRMGTDVPKQLIPLAGKPIMVHTLERFLALDPELIVCVVLHESVIPIWQEMREKHFDASDRKRLLHCRGGAERTSSVQNGLTHLQSQGAEPGGLVAIHDAVRPFLSQKMLSEAYETAAQNGNAVVCVPVKSSLRRKTNLGSEAIDRSQYFHVQTPQIFFLRDILAAYKGRPHDLFTDDASLAESAGQLIHLCMGSYENLKVTTPEDLAIGEIILQGENAEG